MEASTANFRTLFPEFKDPVLSDDQVQFYLDLASEVHRCSETAQLYLAAHFAALDIADGVGDESTDTGDIGTAGEGFAVQQKVGDLSVKYAEPGSATEAEYARTAYGRRANQLMKAAKTRLTVSVHE